MHKITIFIAKPPKNHVVKNWKSKTTVLKTNTLGCISILCPQGGSSCAAETTHLKHQSTNQTC